MEIRLCQDKDEWNQYLLAGAQPSFLQSWDWGEFQRAVGHEPMRIVTGDAQTQCQLQGFRHSLGLGASYLYVPRAWSPEPGVWEEIFEYAKQQGYAFVRVEPESELRITNYELRITGNRQPQHTLILDLNKSTEELLSAMHPKTRYNIHLAERKGVSVRAEKDGEVFWRLNRETARRDQFKSHSKEYYKKMLAFDFVHQLTAEYQGQPIAANILIHFGDTMTYLHGASSQARRDVMAPYWLQWQGMELARRLGCKYYDLWGVARLTPNAERSDAAVGVRAKTSDRTPNAIMTCLHNYCWEADHKWGGITRFKVGFSAIGGPASGGGGSIVSYGQAVDVVLRPWKYKMYCLMYRMYELRKLRNYTCPPNWRELRTVI